MLALPREFPHPLENSGVNEIFPPESVLLRIFAEMIRLLICIIMRYAHHRFLP